MKYGFWDKSLTVTSTCFLFNCWLFCYSYKLKSLGDILPPKYASFDFFSDLIWFHINLLFFFSNFLSFGLTCLYLIFLFFPFLSILLFLCFYFYYCHHFFPFSFSVSFSFPFFFFIFFSGKWHLGGMREENRLDRTERDKCVRPSPNQHGFEEYISGKYEYILFLSRRLLLLLIFSFRFILYYVISCYVFILFCFILFINYCKYCNLNFFSNF